MDDPTAVIEDNARLAVPNELPRATTLPILDFSNRNIVFKIPKKFRDVLDTIRGYMANFHRDVKEVINKTAETVDKDRMENAALHYKI